jgi:hypothetical protein
MAFTYTEHLAVRAYRDADLPLLLKLWNEPRVQETGTHDFVRPRTAAWATEVLAPQIKGAFFAAVLEARAVPPGADDGQRFVGYILLQADPATFRRTRDASLAIALDPRWSVLFDSVHAQRSQASTGGVGGTPRRPHGGWLGTASTSWAWTV